MKKNKISAQYLVDHCEAHGKIVWSELREAVFKDMELAARKREFKQWK